MPCIIDDVYVLVDELGADAEGLGHVAQREGAVRLEELAVGQNTHLAHIVTVVRGEEPVPLHVLLHTSYSGANSKLINVTTANLTMF